MATYYVRTDGHDAATGVNNTNDGVTGAWLTINKALTTIAAGDTVIVASGTYEENSGSNYLAVPNAFASATLIRSESGNAADVVIKPAADAASYVALFGSVGTACSNIEFRDVTFQARTSTQAYVVRVMYCSSATFTRCRFICVGGAGTVNIFALARTGATTIGGIVLDTPYMREDSIGAGKVYGFNSPGTGVTGNITITNPDIALTSPGASYGINITGGSGTQTITGGTVTSDNSVGVVIGSDSDPGVRTTAHMTNVTVTSTHSHGILLGFADNCNITNCTATGGDHGFGFKNSTNCVADHCTFYGGSLAGLAFKAAVNCTAKYCDIYNNNNGDAIQCNKNDVDSVKSGNNTLIYCNITASGSADIFNWGDSTHDSGGSIVNYNTYHLSGTGNYGGIYGTTGITTLAGVRAAWATYPSRNLVQATGAKRLTYKTGIINSIAVVRGDDGAKNLANAIDLISTGNITFFAVTQHSAFNAAGLNHLIDNSKFKVIANDTNDLWNVSSDGTTLAASANNSATVNTPRVLIITRTNLGVVNIYVNGSLSGSADQSSGTPARGLPTYTHNIAAENRGFVGDVAEMGVYKRILTATEITALTNHLKAKYNIS